MTGRAREIAMVFQEPMTSLNPVYTVGEQIAEVVRLHEGLGRERRSTSARDAAAGAHSERGSGACTTFRTSSRAACGSA